ncbi:MAG: hypothetical protein ACKO0V_21335 [bacterium]
MMTNVITPVEKRLEAFDVVTFNQRKSLDSTPLSCNGLASEIETNAHCLIDSLEKAKNLLESGRFDNSEPGPFRIVAVYSVPNP